MRRIFKLICILMLLSSVKGGEQLIFFADDYYKVIGSPKLVGVVVNPVVTLDDKSMIMIALANNGIVEEIISINNSISPDAAQELIEEMHSTDAISVVANLKANENGKSVNDTRSISYLPSGSVKFLSFNISTEALSMDSQELLLELVYAHQVDVGIYNGKPSPLYQQDRIFLPIRILIENAEDSLRILSVIPEFNSRGSGHLLTSIENEGPEPLQNCTAHLIAAPPFSSVNESLTLGDIRPGETVVARFPLKVESKSNPSNLELTLYLTHRNGTAVLSVPITMEMASNLLTNYSIIFMAIVALGFALILVVAKNKKSSSRKSLRKGRLW